MYRPQLAAVLLLALLWIGFDPAVAATKIEHHRTRAAPVAALAALLDLQGAQASLGRPAMNGFVLGLQQASENEPLPFAALIDTKSDPEATKSAARDVVATGVSIAAGFTDNDSVLIAGRFFQRARVPFLSIGATDPALPQVVGNRGLGDASAHLLPVWQHMMRSKWRLRARATSSPLMLAPSTTAEE